MQGESDDLKKVIYGMGGDICVCCCGDGTSCIGVGLRSFDSSFSLSQVFVNSAEELRACELVLTRLQVLPCGCIAVLMHLMNQRNACHLIWSVFTSGLNNLVCCCDMASLQSEENSARQRLQEAQQQLDLTQGHLKRQQDKVGYNTPLR